MSKEEQLETLVICIPGEKKADRSAQAQETLRIAQEVCCELAGLRRKCSQINEIDGHSVCITGLKLTGKTAVEKVEVTYVIGDMIVKRDYSIDEFYNL